MSIQMRPGIRLRLDGTVDTDADLARFSENPRFAAGSLGALFEAGIELLGSGS
jgi:hypothetical protein